LYDLVIGDWTYGADDGYMFPFERGDSADVLMQSANGQAVWSNDVPDYSWVRAFVEDTCHERLYVDTIEGCSPIVFNSPVVFDSVATYDSIVVNKITVLENQTSYDSLVYGTYGFYDSLITVNCVAGDQSVITNGTKAFLDISSNEITHTVGDTFYINHSGVYEVNMYTSCLASASTSNYDFYINHNGELYRTRDYKGTSAGSQALGVKVKMRILSHYGS